MRTENEIGKDFRENEETILTNLVNLLVNTDLEVSRLDHRLHGVVANIKYAWDYDLDNTCTALGEGEDNPNRSFISNWINSEMHYGVMGEFPEDMEMLMEILL